MPNILPFPDRRSFCRTLALGAADCGSPGPPPRRRISSMSWPTIWVGRPRLLQPEIRRSHAECGPPGRAGHSLHRHARAFGGLHSKSLRHSHGPLLLAVAPEAGRAKWYDPNLIEAGRLTVPAILKSRGYHTAGIGKWHLGLGDRPHTDYMQPLRPGPLDHGFDDYFGIPASLDMDPYLYFHNDRPVEMPTAQTAGSNTPRGVFWRAGARAPGFQLEQVLPTHHDKAVASFRERARPPGQPFFLYLALTAPHTPWLPLPISGVNPRRRLR